MESQEGRKNFSIRYYVCTARAKVKRSDGTLVAYYQMMHFFTLNIEPKVPGSIPTKDINAITPHLGGSSCTAVVFTICLLFFKERSSHLTFSAALQ